MMSRSIQLFIAVLAVLMIAGCGGSDGENQEEPTSTASDDDSGVELLAAGDFVSKGGQTTSGSYRIERVGDYRRLLLSNNFATDDGPDLHVVLSPTTVGEADDDKAMATGAAVLDTLSALQGQQVFYLADSLEIGQYQSVLIHCLEMSHLYGAAPVQTGDG